MRGRVGGTPPQCLGLGRVGVRRRTGSRRLAPGRTVPDHPPEDSHTTSTALPASRMGRLPRCAPGDWPVVRCVWCAAPQRYPLVSWPPMGGPQGELPEERKEAPSVGVWADLKGEK